MELEFWLAEDWIDLLVVGADRNHRNWKDSVQFGRKFGIPVYPSVGTKDMPYRDTGRKEWNDEIVFVRRVIPGAADRSYGIQVARLAGLPLSIIDRAKTILAKLESDDTTVSLPAPQAKPKKKITVAPNDDSQLSLL
jgi:sugar phosphate isomerase/epimerase